MVFWNNRFAACGLLKTVIFSQGKAALLVCMLFLGGLATAGADEKNKSVNSVDAKDKAVASSQDSVEDQDVKNSTIPSPARPEKKSLRSNVAKKWLARLSRYRSANPSGKYPDPVKQAFGSVVATARLSTVRILLDESDAILGTIVSPDGLIVTKASELIGKSKLSCQLNDGRQLKARLISKNRKNDLALLKVDAERLPAISWAEEDSPVVGSWLATPGLSNNSLAIGVVSIAPRKIPPARGVLGIEMAPAKNGTRVKKVFPGSGAEKAGIHVDDIIIKVNDMETDSSNKLGRTISSYYPGDKINIHLKRDDEEIELSAVLGSRFPGLHFDQADFQNHLGGKVSERRAGFSRVIQHDTVLKPSDCGGPIVDLNGKAIGINIARAGRVESYALPAAEIKKIIEDLKPKTPDSQAVTQEVKR